MTKQSNLKHIIQTLEHVKKRPSMYVCPLTADSMVNYLCGFRSGMSAVGCAYVGNYIWECQEKRGWEHRACGPVPQMRDKGMTEMEIINELVNIQIDAFKEVLT